MPGEKVRVREAGPEDLPAIGELLCLRDERRNDPDDMRRVLFDLDPERLRAWVAFAGDVPVGLTSIYLRRLRWGGGEKLAGYWAHLYVREEYRERMAFPMLMLAMVKGARAAGVEVMYTITRQPGLASASGRCAVSRRLVAPHERTPKTGRRSGRPRARRPQPSIPAQAK